MFGWFSGNKIYRSEIYEDEFFRLHEENTKLKKAVEELKAKNSKLMTRSLTKDFKATLNSVEQGGVLHVRPEGFNFKPFVDKDKNLLEIKLKDTDSVPEVWYEGERLGESPNGLVGVKYSWETTDAEEIGMQDFNINYLDHYDEEGNCKDRYLDMKTISHKRVGG